MAKKTELTNLELLSEELQTAANQFIQFVVSGNYAKMNTAKKNCDAAKEELKSILIHSEEKRHIFREQGMVAKFVPKKIQETDHSGLIEEILCYIRSEALSQVITFNKTKMEEDGVTNVIIPYQYPLTYYVKPTLNKHGKSFNAEKEYFKGESTETLLKAIKHYSEQEKQLKNEYSELMRVFSSMQQQKISLEVGSISKIANKPMYNIYQLINELGEDFVLKYGEVKLSKLEEWINIGALPANIASNYQTVVDVRLDFMVMTFEAEQRMLEAFNQKQFRAIRRYTA